jgi:hypothetical protein
MKELPAYEKSVTIYQSTQRNIPEEFNLKKKARLCEKSRNHLSIQ